MPLARVALCPVLTPGWVEMPPACPHLPARHCLVSEPSPARQGGETIRLSPMSHLHRLPQMQSPMSHLRCPRRHRAWDTADGCFPQATTHGCSEVFRSALVPAAPRDSKHGRPRSSAPPHGLVPADPRPLQGCANACSPGQLFPLFTPGRKEELVSKGKIRGIVLCEASSGISGGQETGIYSPWESDLQKDLEDVNLPPRASVCPPAPQCCAGYLWLCLSHKWGKEAGALPAVFRPQLQAMAQLPLLSVSSEQERRSASRGKGG